MFENNGDFDLEEDFSLNVSKPEANVSKRRLAQSQVKETPKKQKIIQIPKNVVKRKFPGPAGILPERKDLWVNPEKEAINVDEIPCSQMSLSIFQCSPWTDAIQDYENLTEIYNIKWIKTNAGLNKLLNQKAPFLAAIIKSIECFESKNLIVKIVLKDLSGEIQGTVIHSLYEEHLNSLVPGSVIVLRHCGILTTIYSNNHYLTITPKNLVAIYWKNKEEVVVTNLQEIPKEMIQDFPKERKSNNEENFVINGSQVKIRGGEEDIKVWKAALDGVDMDSFLEDF